MQIFIEKGLLKKGIVTAYQTNKTNREELIKTKDNYILTRKRQNKAWKISKKKQEEAGFSTFFYLQSDIDTIKNEKKWKNQ